MNDDFDEKLREMAKRSNVKEPEELRNKIDITCENFKSKRFSNKSYATVAALFIAVVMAIGSYSSTYAKEIPFVKKVISYFTEKYDSINEGHEENSQSENIIVKSNGYNISIEDIYYDRVEMTIFYKIKSDKPLNREAKYLLESEFKGEIGVEVRWGNQEGEFIDDYTYGGMYQCYLSEINGEELSEVLKGRLKINGLRLDLEDNYEDISLQLESIPLILDSTRIKSEEIDINKIVYTADYSTEYIKATINPAGMDLDYKIGKEYIGDYDIGSCLWDSKKGYLKGEVNKGKYPSEIVTSHRYEIPSADGEVMIIPYRYSNRPFRDGEDNFKSINIEKETKFDLGEHGTMEIGNIEFKESETIMTIKTNGYISFDPFRIGIYDNEYNRYYPISVTNREIYGIMEMKADYVFKPMDSTKEYSFVYLEHEMLEVLEDQIIKIK
ncbi:DUF4179 domain-containing protein [Clostridium gasigenes]|uniref:DUF4179 domain-containing protein n=1 Tax=Clostridium gasigenes TaxID=94869 RepID=UPI001625F92F|nr:DUF4179 domain-containing protein [Clostridium gasigenes]MBB6624680.1 DUF4179 domain-containing protein [Clostridium gasigenes]MBU3087276.1 DUF4179 domain-containing protein [Clostridium gasigenes]MBU3130911.1 DUF4179 domain-containing protein [Clostridium gasigenes]